MLRVCDEITMESASLALILGLVSVEMASLLSDKGIICSAMFRLLLFSLSLSLSFLSVPVSTD